ncbi:MAG TPA: gluconate:H+ symporter [Sphingomonas sp.]|uniref:gluconate:H+ symporter n=1 Tax=Sphingomonas sp. TaxID=28214 RepID=UPI002C5D5695|nr:gluconate:H+ symporter [Sphingomonas sp.]HMI19514.1 gluconate:H+ symporter [Sphingomonas sp.]
MTLLPIIAAVALLVLLIAAGKVPPFVAFIIAALAAALMLGMPLAKIPGSIEKGIGDLLGGLAGVIVLGAMFGKLIADSGAAQRIAESLISLFGQKRLPIAMTATGFIVGIPLFYNVGFVLMVPLVFSITYRAKLPAIYVGMPLFAGLSIAHGFLPPHPSPTALVTQFNANLGLTLIYGLIVGIPTLLIAGPLFATTLKGIVVKPSALFKPSETKSADLPGAFNSFACALLPVVLIAATTALAYWPGIDPNTKSLLTLVGNPTIVLLVSLAIAAVTLGTARGKPLREVMDGFGGAIRDIAAILLIIGGAGALKQVLVDSGTDAQLAAMLGGLPIPPLLLGWLLAFAIRIALGSATVAGLTAASLIRPLVLAGHANPNLMVLAVGAGSLMCSHVNDSGFWMFKEYFGLSLRDTFRSWTAMETIVGTFGLGFVLLLSLWV